MTEILYQKADNGLSAFWKAHADDAGYDIYSLVDICLFAHQTRAILTNLRVCIPKGYMGLLTGRSGLSTKGILAHLGIIDAGYTGIVRIVLSNLSSTKKIINRGDRIGQLIFLKLPKIALVEKEFLPETDRGAAGMGSTGQ